MKLLAEKTAKSVNWREGSAAGCSEVHRSASVDVSFEKALAPCSILAVTLSFLRLQFSGRSKIRLVKQELYIY